MSLYLCLDEQRRFELPPEIVAETIGVKLEPSKSLELWAINGDGKNLQILGPDHELSKLKAVYDNDKESLSLTWDARGDERALLIRKLEGFLRVVCHREHNRRKLRITLASNAVDLGLVQAPGNIVVFASGEILEVWQMSNWLAATAIHDLRRFTRDVRNILGRESS